MPQSPGIQMKVNGWGWEDRDVPIGSEEMAEATWPWYSHVIRCFGPSRCMVRIVFSDPEYCVQLQPCA